jgi:hypothetical protein
VGRDPRALPCYRIATVGIPPENAASTLRQPDSAEMELRRTSQALKDRSFIVHSEWTSSSQLDCITNVGSSTRVDCGCLMTKGSEKGAEHDVDRRRLPPELSGDYIRWEFTAKARCRRVTGLCTAQL